MFDAKMKVQKNLGYALGKCARTQETDALFREVFVSHQENIRCLLDRIDELMKENERLKRDVDIESKQKEELAELLTESERDAHCQEDCKNRNKQNMCRSCTRFPNARDNYEVES